MFSLTARSARCPLAARNGGGGRCEMTEERFVIRTDANKFNVVEGRLLSPEHPTERRLWGNRTP
jgi:hypothetical protein